MKERDKPAEDVAREGTTLCIPLSPFISPVEE
jgi:hypothetical protein